MRELKEKFKVKRFLAMLVTMSMTVAIFAGCGNTETVENAKVQTDESSETEQTAEATAEEANDSLKSAETVTEVPEIWFVDAPKQISDGAAADITDELEARGWLDQMNPAIRELLSDENCRVYGIPRYGYALGMMINVELFEEAGIMDENGYPIYPKTWDELAQTAKIIKEKTGAAGLCLLAKDNAAGWHFANIAWTFGACLCTDNGDGTFTAELASEEAVAAMEYVKDLKWKYDVLTEAPTSEDWSTGFEKLGTGAAAMYIGANDAVNQPTQVYGLAVDKLAMCPIPEGPGGQYSLFSGTAYMFSTDTASEEITAALDYLESIGRAPDLSEEAATQMAADAKNSADEGIPVIRRFPCWTSQEVLDSETEIIQEYSNVDSGMFQSYFDAVSTKGLRLEEFAHASDLYIELTEVLQEVLINENADVRALMEQANDNYQETLDVYSKCFLTNPESENSTYGDIIAGLGENGTYAFLEMDYNYMVLLTSDLIYDEGAEQQAAVYCDVYYYVDDDTKKIGTIMSDGTAYPITFTTDGIFAASGHKIEKYAISEEGTLYLEKGVYEQFDEAGNVQYISIIGGQERESIEQEYLEMVNEYGRSQIVHFTYGAEDSVNEFHEMKDALDIQEPERDYNR